MKTATTILSLLILTVLTIACSHQTVPSYPDSRILSCEPLGIMNLPQGACVGTEAARPVMTSQGCLCENEEYAAISTDAGRTCVHLHAVLSLLETIRVTIESINLSPKVHGVMNYLPTETIRRITKLTVLESDALTLRETLFRGKPQHDIDLYVRRVRRNIHALGSEQHTASCVPSPEPTSREEILSNYVPLE